MFEGDRIDHERQKQKQHDLGKNVYSDLETTDFLSQSLSRLLDFFSHSSQPPFAGLKCLISQRQHHDGHADVENDGTGVDDSAGKRSHVLDGGKVPKQFARRGADFEEDELNQSQKEQKRDRTKRNDRRNNLVFG